ICYICGRDASWFSLDKGKRDEEQDRPNNFVTLIARLVSLNFHPGNQDSPLISYPVNNDGNASSDVNINLRFHEGCNGIASFGCSSHGL
ncbi:Hypothetical predicted protein, partial [Paramuricea clavata]